MKQKYKGIICIIFSAFCFACMNIFIRLAGNLPSVEKSFFRNLVALIFALIIILKNRVPIDLQKGDLKYLTARATFGTVGILCNFYAVDHMVVSDASMLNKLSPFFAVVFSIFLLKEKVKPVQMICILVAFAGTLFIIKPGFVNVSIVPALLGMLGGMAAGIAYTFVRALGMRGVKGPFIVFYFSTFSCLVTLPLMMLNYVPMTSQQLLILLGAGLAAAGGQFGITAAYTFAPAREVSIYDYTQIIFATMLSFFILGEMPDVFSFIGYGVICAASVVMFFYNKAVAAKQG